MEGAFEENLTQRNGETESLCESHLTSLCLYHLDEHEQCSKKSKSLQPTPLHENMLSKSLGDIISSLRSTDLLGDDYDHGSGKQNNSEQQTSIPIPSSKGRGSISVDLNADETNFHQRRGGLNPIDEAGDAATVLDKFRESRRRSEKSDGSGLSQSLEDLDEVGNSKGNFITRHLKKPGSLKGKENNHKSLIVVQDSTQESPSKVVECRVNEKGELIRTAEIHKTPNQRLGFNIKFGNGIDRDDGIFISRVALGSLVDSMNLMHTGDEILKINQVEVSGQSLEDVVSIMQKTHHLVIESRSALPLDTHIGIIGPQTSSSFDTRTGSSTDFPRTLFPKNLKEGGVQGNNVSCKELPCIARASADTYDASSSDSDELSQLDDKEMVSYQSDEMTELNDHRMDKIVKHSFTEKIPFHKSFTGKLTVQILTISGMTSEAVDNTRICYCTIEINDEFKAKTQQQNESAEIVLDDEFDIDVQLANVMTIKLYRHERILADKCLAISKIFLERIFQEGKQKKFTLISIKDRIETKLNVKFTKSQRYFKRRQSSRAAGIFGFNISHTLSTEMNTIPILVRKCVTEIEKRGLVREGIYRISGNARKKRELREQFEHNSHHVDLSDTTIDCHVITGVLKDYLRKLPKPLISDEMYKIIHQKQKEGGESNRTTECTLLSQMIQMAPHVNRATLLLLLEHFHKVIEQVHVNKMDSSNIAVCFGPVMMSPPIEEMKNFQKYVDALEFLINIWPKQSDDNMV